jgi:hypothetical protein
MVVVGRSAWPLAFVPALLACAASATHEPGAGVTDDAGQSQSGPDGAPPADASATGTPEAAADATPGGGLEGSAEGGAQACASLPLCDGFEADTPGTAPTGWNVVMGCNPNTQDTAVEGGGLLVGVDSSQHHGGKNSLRVVGGDSCGYYAVSASAFAALGSQVYARLWVMFSRGPTQGHNGFLSMATTGGDHFRLGFQDGVVAWNAQMSDATLPDMDPQGTSLSVAPAATTWTCIELHIDEASGHLETWINGAATAVAGLTWNGTTVQGVDDQWARGAPSPPVPKDLGLGWLGLNDQETVWFDDVALAGSRIGCN